MLDDRPYMRSEYRPYRAGGAMPLWQILIIINIAVFLIQMMFEGGNPERALWINSHFALSLNGLLHGYVWQLVTYQFMHANIIHLVFNCLGLYFVGRIVASMLSRKAFLALFFSGGIIGGFLQALSGLVPALGAAPTVGASAAVMALLGAFCLQFYHQRFQMMFPPVTLSGKHLLIVVAIFDALGILMGDRGVAHFAHLGGLATGVLFIKYGWQHRIPEFKFGGSSTSGKRNREASRPTRTVNARVTIVKEDGSAASQSGTDFMSKEVDPILEKISAHGIHSLTDREREILEKAQKQMSKR